MTRKVLFLKSVALVTVMAGVGLACLVCVRCIPDERVMAHCRKSAEILAKEGDWPRSCRGICRDNCSDSLLLNVASCSVSEGNLTMALLNPHLVIDKQESRVAALAARFSVCSESQAKDPLVLNGYARYWFGAVAFIRPVLWLMDYGCWRVCNTVLLCATLLGLLYLMCTSGLSRYVIPFVISVLLMDPLAIGGSLQYSPCFYIAVVSSALMILLPGSKGVMAGGRLCLAFTLIGAVTSFLDLLTFPVVTLSFPLAFCVLLNRDQGIRSNGSMVLTLAFYWGVGYVLMWSSKWFLATALTDANVFSDVFNQISYRAGTKEADLSISRVHAVAVNVRAFFGWSTAFLAGFCFLPFAAVLCGGFKTAVRQIPLLLIALLPLLWMFATANHVYRHYFFTSKSVAVVVFVVLCWCADALVARCRPGRS